MLCRMVRNTPRAIALGQRLRAAREAKAMSLRTLAKQVGIEHTALGRFELGERSPSPEQVSAILAVLGVNGPAANETIDLSRDTSGTAWLAIGLPEQRTQMAALLEIEQLATEIVDVSPLLFPGLLQTGPYARAIMRAAGVPEDEVETRVAVRLGRRDILTRDNPVHLTALIGETVLTQTIGDDRVMQGQLDHALKMAAMPNVDLRAIPQSAGWHPALEGPFVILTIDGSTSMVHLENRRSGLFLQEGEDLAAYKAAAEKVLQLAMSPARTAELIKSAADGIKRIE